MKTKLTSITRLILICGIIFFANSIFAADAATNSVSQTNEPSPFQIVVTPAKTRVHIGEPFNVALEVRNVSNTNQSIGVWSCGWDENWRSSNPNIVLLGEVACIQNGVKHISLAPGESFRQKWDWGKKTQMQVLPTVKTNKITFRISFIPSTWGNMHIYNPKTKSWQTNQWWIEDPKNTYWSDDVIVNINPKAIPDWIPW